MTEQQRVNQLYFERQLECEQLIAVGLPGCLALGYVPGDSPGALKRADAYHELLVKVLLRVLPEIPVH
jgi:hypothetical protein